MVQKNPLPGCSVAAWMPHEFQSLLSHNSADKPAVEALALRLRQETDIEPWLDKCNLIPGQPWQEELEVAIKGCDSCVIFIGRGDPQSGVIGPDQRLGRRAKFKQAHHA